MFTRGYQAWLRAVVDLKSMESSESPGEQDHGPARAGPARRSRAARATWQDREQR